MTTSTHLDISQAIGRAMMGQKDYSISLHYNDFGGPKLMLAITEAHVKTLKELVRGSANDNIFSNTPIEFNEDYFKTLWSRFKKKRPEIGKHTTIYSFRHSGAIEIFKRIGSLHKL